jgi:hypothetical protein
MIVSVLVSNLPVLQSPALGKPQAVISEETAQEAEGNEHARGTVRNGSTKSKDGGHISKKL